MEPRCKMLVADESAAARAALFQAGTSRRRSYSAVVSLLRGNSVHGLPRKIQSIGEKIEFIGDLMMEASIPNKSAQNTGRLSFCCHLSATVRRRLSRKYRNDPVER